MNECENHHSIVVFFRYSNNIKIIVFMEIKEMIFFVHNYGPIINRNLLECVFVIFKDFFIEGVVDVARDIGPKMPGNEHSAFFIENVKG